MQVTQRINENKCNVELLVVTNKSRILGSYSGIGEAHSNKLFHTVSSNDDFVTTFVVQNAQDPHK